MKSKSRRAMFVIWGLKPGGAERVFINIVNNIKSFKPLIVVLNKEEGFAKYIKKRIEIIYLNKRNKLDFFRIIFKLSNLIKREKLDIIVSFGYYANHLTLLAKYITNTKIPVCISERIDTKLFIENNYNFKILREFLIRKLYNTADKIIAVSYKVKENLIKFYKINEDKISIINNPVDIEKINEMSLENVEHNWFKDNNIILISVGRLHPQKDHKTLIKAFAKLIKKYQNLKLIIIGDGKEKPKLEKIIKDLKLDDKVALLGYQENPYKYMSRADIFILSSVYEGFPNVILEAMACGLPIISTECASELVINGINGLLVPSKDCRKLSEAIEKLLSNPNLMTNFSNENKKRIKNYSLPIIINKYEELFLKVIKDV